MLLSKSVLVGYDRHSTTERVFVTNDELATQRLRKIQSVPGSKVQVKIYAAKNFL